MENKNLITKISTTALFLLILNSSVLAVEPDNPFSFHDITNKNKEYSQYLDESDVYYKKGMEYYRLNEYTKAIDALKRSLELTPDRDTTRVNLAATYINRGTYYFNKENNLEQATNDYRNAIYYLKYDGYNVKTKVAEENIFISEKNLDDAIKASRDEYRLKNAKNLYGQGKYPESIVEYHAALEKNINNIEIYEAIGDIYSAMQKSKLAADNYRKALSEDKRPPELHLKYARALQNIGNNEIAIKEFNIALNTSKEDKKNEILKDLENIWIEKIRENPSNPSAHMNLGVVFQKKGDFESALKEYKIAETFEPNDVTTRLNIGTLFQAKKEYTTALRAYDTIIQVKPDHILAHYYKGTALKEMNKLDDAINEFQFILSKDVNNLMAKEALFQTVMLFPNQNDTIKALSTFARNNPGDALTQYKFAFYLHSIKRPDEAMEYYNRTIQIDPKYTDAYLNIASIYKEKNQIRSAIGVLKDALKVMPDNKKVTEMISLIESEVATVRYNNALQMHTQGKYQEAINEYKNIIEISEPDGDLYVNLGAAYQALNNNKEAIQAYEKAIKLDESNSTAYYYLGTAYFQEEDYEKALKTYQKALAIDPKNETIKKAIASSKQVMTAKIFEKGINEYNQGKYKEALLSLNTALITEPENADIYFQRGIVYDAMEKYPLAVSDYEHAVRYNSEMTMAYYALAVDYDQLKNFTEAKKWYQKFIEKSQGKEDEYVKYAKERVSLL